MKDRQASLTYLFGDRQKASSSGFTGQSDGVVIAGPGHMVQFYDEASFVNGTLREFVGTGLHAGHACVVIASKERIRETEGQLADAISQSVNTSKGHYVALDAHEALEAFMVGGQPDWQQFVSSIGRAVHEAGKQGGLVRVYSEIVAILWQEGKYDAAIQVENFWNNLSSMYTFFLYTTYAQYPSHHIMSSHSADTDLPQETTVQPETLQTEINHRKETEAALEQLEARTSGLLAEREYLMELNTAKDEFISLASHQLRTPATGVKQYIGMLLQGFMGDLTDAQRTGLQKAYESNERQLKIVNDLLLVARVDAGKITLSKESCDIVQLITDVANEQQEEIHARGQHIALRLPRKLALPADPRYLRMVIENLVNNASKYSGDGLPITITARRHNGQGCISIKDQGVGISKQDMPRLYQKFSRIYNKRSSVVDGTGLGLYWSKKIVELFGGTLTVASRVNHGSTFTISLPLQ